MQTFFERHYLRPLRDERGGALLLSCRSEWGLGDLPPPPPPIGLFVLPTPFFVAMPAYVAAPAYVVPPQNNIVFNNIQDRKSVV